MAEQEQKANEAAVQKAGSSFRLEYLGGFGGRGEPIKLAASLSGVAFTSHMFSGDDQKKMKANGTQVWSGPPDIMVLDKDGNDVVALGQSNSILRLLGKKTGLYPEKALDAAFVDGILDSQEDVLNNFVPKFLIQQGDAKTAGAKELITDIFPFWFGRLETRLAENEQRGNDKGYFVGNALTIADLKSYSNLCLIRFMMAGEGIAELLADKEKYARLQKFLGVMDADEQIKKAVATYNANYEAFKTGTTTFEHEGKYVDLAE